MHYKITRAWIKNGRLWYFVEGRLAPELTPVFSKSFGIKPPFATAQVKQQDGLIVWAVGDPASEADATPEQLAIGPQLEKVDLTQASLRQMMQDHAVAGRLAHRELVAHRVVAEDLRVTLIRHRAQHAVGAGDGAGDAAIEETERDGAGVDGRAIVPA